MRSRRALGIGSARFAVAINITRDKSNGSPEIVIAKGMILFRVKHFQESCRRVATDIHADFVHLVEHKHRIGRPGLAHALQNAPGNAPT